MASSGDDIRSRSPHRELRGEALLEALMAPATPIRKSFWEVIRNLSPPEGAPVLPLLDAGDRVHVEAVGSVQTSAGASSAASVVSVEGDDSPVRAVAEVVNVEVNNVEDVNDSLPVRAAVAEVDTASVLVGESPDKGTDQKSIIAHSGLSIEKQMKTNMLILAD